jgi:flagellar assembly protein FliH
MSKIIKQGENEYSAWTVPAVQGTHVVNRGADDRSSVSGNLRARLDSQKQEEGFEKGYQHGMKEAAKVVAIQSQKVKYLEQLLCSLNEPFDELDQQVEQELVTLAVAIAQQIIRREIKIDPGQIMAVIREALDALPAASRNIKIALHPEDASLVRELTTIPNENQLWQLAEDPTLMRGGCKVTTNTSQIDASVESRLAAIFAQILGGEREQDKPPVT